MSEGKNWFGVIIGVCFVIMIVSGMVYYVGKEFLSGDLIKIISLIVAVPIFFWIIKRAKSKH